MNTRKFHLALGGLSGLAMLIALFLNKPDGIWLALPFGLSVGTAFALWSRNDTWGIRTLMGLLVGIAAGLLVLWRPMLTPVAWVVFAVAQTYLILRILAGRPYKLDLNGVVILFSSLVGGVLGILVHVLTTPWIGLSIGLYVFAILFRRLRTLGPKARPKKRANIAR